MIEDGGMSISDKYGDKVGILLTQELEPTQVSECFN